jgi:hypothetical protein
MWVHTLYASKLACGETPHRKMGSYPPRSVSRGSLKLSTPALKEPVLCEKCRMWFSTRTCQRCTVQAMVKRRGNERFRVADAERRAKWVSEKPSSTEK